MKTVSRWSEWRSSLLTLPVALNSSHQRPSPPPARRKGKRHLATKTRLGEAALNGKVGVKKAHDVALIRKIYHA
jgi:hypothetical protein